MSGERTLSKKHTGGRRRKLGYGLLKPFSYHSKPSPSPTRSLENLPSPHTPEDISRLVSKLGGPGLAAGSRLPHRQSPPFLGGSRACSQGSENQLTHIWLWITDISSCKKCPLTAVEQSARHVLFSTVFKCLYLYFMLRLIIGLHKSWERSRAKQFIIYMLPE